MAEAKKNDLKIYKELNMKKNKLFIGISGKMAVGKSTVSKLLKEAFQIDNKVILTSLASPIYKVQDMIYNEYKIGMVGDKDRDLLIAIGLWGRNKHPDFWLEQFVRQSLDSEYEIILCDDIRFENEANFFKKHGLLFRIEGEQRGDNIDISKANDPTECSLDEYEFDNVISNKLSPENMCKEIAKVLMAGK